MMFVIGPLTYSVGAVMLVALARWIAGFVSSILAKWLNAATWSQIRASGYGGDTQGEVAIGAQEFPELLNSAPALPPDLAAEITAISDRAAAASVSKFRASLNKLAFSEGDQPRSDVISNYLTWEELIHTTYFKVPHFVKLVAYAVAHSDGFRPTPALLSDPDFERVAGWYRQICNVQDAPGSTLSRP